MPGARRGRVAIAAALLICAAGPTPAATLFGATSWHVLGDSLSDKGRIYDLSFGLVPESPPYWKGRFSNGPVWAETVADAFKDAKLPTSNQAYGGAQATRDRDGIPDIGLQARAYRALPSKRKGDAPMAAILAGANDLMRAGRDDVRRVGKDAADDVASTARYLTRRGVAEVLVINLPDLGRIPKYGAPKNADRAAAATRGARAFNNRLDRRVEEMREDGLAVRGFDLYGAFNALLDDPEAFGFDDTTTPCLVSGDRCGKKKARGKVFFDDIHPTKATHAYFADLILDDLSRPAESMTLVAGPLPAPRVAAVPLPAPAGLLLVALAGLAVAARRRSRAG